MKQRYFWLFAMLLVGFCGCEEDVSAPNSLDSILGSGDSKDNVIYYVTTDNRLLEVDENDFNAPIFKHEYYKDKEYGKIVFMADVTIIGDSAFEICSLRNVTIPDSVVEIGKGAFDNCWDLISITIPDSVVEIGEGAFNGCTSLRYVTLPNDITEIKKGVFSNCFSLTNIHIPSSVANIREIAFFLCESLTTVTIPNGVTEIGQQAFDGCSSLASIYCTSTTPPSGSDGMFDGNASGRKIYVPTASVKAYKSAEYWSDYADDIVGDDAL